MAGQQSASDQERILRLTRNYAAKFPLLDARQVQSIIQDDRGRHVLISLQNRQEYEAGHVPGSMLFPPEDLASLDRLSALVQKLPQDKPIIIICPNGHLSSAVMLFLRQLKLDASAMSMGMDGWNRASAGKGAYRGDIAGEISRTPALLKAAQASAPPVYSELDDNALIMRNTNGRFIKEISPSSMQGKREGLLLCLRRPEDYAAGHIPDSINIPSEAFLAGDKIITQLPLNQKIVLSCYVGHYSAGAALLLTQLGYDTSIFDWGMAGWNNKHIGPVLQTLTQNAALPVESGPGRLYLAS